MNYLELCQKLCLEADISGGAGAISTTSGQSGELARIVHWITESYKEIQNRHPSGWRWLKREFQVVTQASTKAYAYDDAAVTDITAGGSSPIDRFYSWHIADREDPPTIYLQSAGENTENWIISTSWENYRQVYEISQQNDSYPAHITADPQDRLILGPAPNDVYVVKGQYFRGPQILGSTGDPDAEIPEMPEPYHMLIVYTALEKYGWFEAANEVILRAQRENRKLMRQLEKNQMTRLRFRGPMV